MVAYRSPKPCRVSSILTTFAMSEARRQRRLFKRAYDKATKLSAVKPALLEGNPALQELVDKLIKDYETESSSK